MREPMLEIRQTKEKGRGVFALEDIVQGRKILVFQGHVLKTLDLTDDLLAMQIDHDLWLCSDGSLLDDCVNHSCEPNSGFLHGDPSLYALRDIAADEEICWDYSTSIADPGWKLDCRCGSPRCRGVVLPWGELEHPVQERLRPIALSYLRGNGRKPLS
jgi:hypothetical protein